MVLTLEFTPVAHALLKAIALEGKHPSVEAMLRHLIEGESRPRERISAMAFSASKSIWPDAR